MKPLPILLILIMFFGLFVLISSLEDDKEIYDTVVTESVEVTYQNGDIDTIEVDRNTMCDYILDEGDFKVNKEPISNKTIYYSSSIIKSGVRDYKIINND